MPEFRRGIGTPAPDYDMAAWQAATGLQTLPPGQHYPDTYKLPNHMTFSNESMYSTPERQGGQWTVNPDKTYTFTPGPENFRQHTPQQMLDYFKRVEPGNFLNLPAFRTGTTDAGGTDMAPQLKRGIAHYQGGTENATTSDATAPPVATSLPVTFSTAPPPAPAQGTLSRIGSLFTGNFGGVATDPNASPFMSWLAGINQTAQTDTRARNVASGPSLAEKAYTGLFGNQATDWPALQQRDATAKVLGDPVVQHTLRTNPSMLTRAEQNPAEFATVAQHPDFRADMEKAVAVHNAAAANPKVETADEHKATVDKATNANVHPDVAHQAVAPQKYTREQFINTFSKVPTETFMQLFGNQLGHVVSPQEKAASIFFDKMHDTYAEANQKVKDMEAQDAEAAKAGKPAIHNKYVLWGQNPYDLAKAERDKAMKATMDALGSFAGITNKGYVVPGQQ
jgi:hypothetical protein